nr:uncharacterized protein LOC124497706 [Dermatophagoides farinae]
MGGQCSIIPNQEPEYQLIMMPQNHRGGGGRGRRRSSCSSSSRMEKSMMMPQQPIPIYGYSGYPIIQGYPAPATTQSPNPYQTPAALFSPYHPYLPSPLLPPPPPAQQHIYQQTSKEFCSPELYESMLRMLTAEMQMKQQKYQQQQQQQPNMSYNDEKSSSYSRSRRTSTSTGGGREGRRRRSQSESSKSRRRRNQKMDGKTRSTTLSETFSQRKPNYHFDTQNIRDQTPKQLAQKIQQLLNNNDRINPQDQQQERIRRLRRQRRSKVATASAAEMDETIDSQKSNKSTKQKENSIVLAQEKTIMMTEPFELNVDDVVDNDDEKSIILRPKIAKIPPSPPPPPPQSTSKQSDHPFKEQLIKPPIKMPDGNKDNDYYCPLMMMTKSSGPQTPNNVNDDVHCPITKTIVMQKPISTHHYQHRDPLPIYGYSGGYPVISGMTYGTLSMLKQQPPMMMNKCFEQKINYKSDDNPFSFTSKSSSPPSARINHSLEKCMNYEKSKLQPPPSPIKQQQQEQCKTTTTKNWSAKLSGSFKKLFNNNSKPDDNDMEKF